MARMKAREEFFKLMFECDMKNIKPSEVYLDFISRFEKGNIEEDEVEFIKEYSVGISAKYDEINDIIIENMQGWNMDRIGTVERVLLRLATFEILDKKEVGYKISVNEAVELSKKYGEDKSHEFVNGVLANIIKKKL